MCGIYIILGHIPRVRLKVFPTRDTVSLQDTILLREDLNAALALQYPLCT